MFQFFAVFSNLKIQIPFVSSPGHQKYQQLLSTSTKPPRENLTMKPFTNYLNLQGFKTFFPLRRQPSKNKPFGLCSQSFPTAPVEVIMRPPPAMDPDVRPCNHQKFASFQPQRFPIIPPWPNHFVSFWGDKGGILLFLVNQLETVVGGENVQLSSGNL